MNDGFMLHVETDTGRVLNSVREADGFTMFMIPDGVTQVYVVARSERNSGEVDPFVEAPEPRVSEIIFWDSTIKRRIDTHLTADDLPGWGYNTHAGSRPVAGRALLPLGKRKNKAIGMLGLKIDGPAVVSVPVQAKTLESHADFC